MKLMIGYIQEKKNPTFHKIHEANFFCPLSDIHRCSTSSIMKIHTIERSKKLKGKLKVIERINGFALSPLNDTSG